MADHTSSHICNDTQIMDEVSHLPLPWISSSWVPQFIFKHPTESQLVDIFLRANVFYPMEGCDIVEGRLWQAWGLSMSKSLVRVSQSEVWVMISRYSPLTPCASVLSLHT